MPLVEELRRVVGDAHAGHAGAAMLADASEQRAFAGHADAVVAPASAEEVAAVVAWCYEHDVPITPRGGGSGLAGGAVPVQGGVVLDLSRLSRLRAFESEGWRMQVEAGMRTSEVARRAREHGLWFPPDPGAAEQSTIGGNIATNAGGPHAFRYGVTGAWVTGLEAVIAPGEIVRTGGPVRKDVAGLDLKSLLIGSEGVLGIVTAAWLRLIPAPEAALPVVAVYPDAAAGQRAMSTLLASGVQPAVLEFLDAGAVAAAAGAFPGDGLRAAAAGFMLIAEADGTPEGARVVREELLEVLGEEGTVVHAPEDLAGVRALWRWRDGVSLSVVAQRGGKLSEDIAVPPERLAEAVAGTLAIGERHGLAACSWGHAGDGNFHSTFLLDREDPAEIERAEAAAHELFDLAIALGGTISGEHGIGALKRPDLERFTDPAVRRLHAGIKAVFDPKGLLNPGKAI